MADGTPVTYEELPDELKKKYDEVKVILEADLIGSYHKTRSHGVRRKGFSPEGALDGVDLSVPSEERTRAVRQEISGMVTHSLRLHSESLVNTLEHVAVRMIKEVMKNQRSLLEPALGTYRGKVPLQPRLPSSFTSAAPEVPNSPSRAVDRVNDTYPGRCQPGYLVQHQHDRTGHPPDEDRGKGNCSHSEDKEEAAPCDRPRHRQNILVMIKVEADASNRPVVSVSPALPVCGVDLTGDGKLGYGFTSADELEEVDIGPGDKPRPTFISKKLDPQLRGQMIALLKEYPDCFAWDYTEMPGLDRSIIEHRLPLKKGFRPFQQRARQMRAEILEEVKKEIEKMLDQAMQQQAFDEIKRYLTTPPVLVPPQQDRPFYIYLSVADTSIASVVVQLYDGVEKVVFYLSRRMLDAETRYPEVEKLCLCLFFTCTKLHHILLTAEIIVICKSDVVKHMLSAPVLKGRLDYFTKWVEAVPMKKVKSEDVIKFVKEHVIHRFGIPQTITTDGGSVFTSKEFRKFCDDLGIKLIRSSPYYAQANGQAEASNQSLIKLIKRKIDENPRDWHEKLSEALWAYRMSCHGAIKTSPYQLVYGQEAVLPWEITAGSRRVTFQNDLTAEEYAALMSDTIEDATELRLWSLEKIKENKARVARAYNKKVRPKEFQVGDLVWEAVLPLGTRDKAYGKWSPNWHGPYKVVQALKGNAYMLEELSGEKFPVAVNGQHLKKYFPSMWDDGQ
ncbi:hypothetical protein QYE76_060428 [Lolium multiflorum]|uniref:Integrase catalytic domain-containing protein n=1 Tax=Lolium multiflorum TaxID=4521 RepID=A0AAD8S0F0_LOLMU|nr:hypothetical protein QYE76_060428 [Lolium multiflorum]